MTIFVVDDEEHIVELIKFNLEKEGFKVVTCGDGKEAVRQIKEIQPDLVILDIMLPGVSGFEICRYLRQNDATKKLPIIMISARSEEFDRVLGLEMGADDYITKPFSPRELVARVKVRLRIHREMNSVEDIEEQKIVKGDIEIYPKKYMVCVGGVKQPLTPKEFELLYLFACNPGKVFSREYLLDKIWGYEYHGYSRTVDVHVRSLRKKLGLDGSRGGVYIESLRGIGYRLTD